MENSLLWRVVYTPHATLRSDSFCAGPWHPDKAHIERCVGILGGTHPVGIQSNSEAARGACSWAVQPRQG